MAPGMIVEGDVVAVHGYWTDDRSRIVTEATVQTPDGPVVVSQLGGSADGIGMITIPGPPRLELGMQVAVAAHTDLDRSQREHVVLDSVKVLADPPDYVRRGPTRAGHFLYWESRCVFLTIDDAGTIAIPGDGEFPVIDASIATWNDAATPSCSYLKLMSDGRQPLEVGNDHVNLIKFRDTTWGRPAVGNDPPRMYPAQAAAFTTVLYVDDGSARDGAIYDADIELNGVYFAIAVNGQTSANSQLCHAELQNTLTHELGHLIGLEHTCLALGDPQRIDGQGNPVPDCSAVAATPTLPASMQILDATMYPFQDCGETKKATLSSDDIQALCGIYPVARDPGICSRVGADGLVPPDDVGADSAVPSGGHGCCDASASARPDASLVLAGATFVLVMRRRRAART
ncbi:MAG TPA: hypothetical protein VF516_13815 [Kofleriaceae bacterium]